MRILVIFPILLTLSRADNGGYNYDTSDSDVKSFPDSNSPLSDNKFKSTVHFDSPNVELHKEFLTYSAPEGDVDEITSEGENGKTSKKNIRIIFIRSPEYKGLTDAIANLVKNNLERKTAIYVLTKQTDLSDLTNKLQHLTKKAPNKPEVHFIKYRTQEEAENAQKQIQQQYESLGGPTQVHNEGIAPVLNFVSKGSEKPPYHSSNRFTTPASGYLPIV